MKTTTSLEIYIQQKLADLDKEKDMKEITLKGKLSFGIDSTTYGHLPAWKTLLKEKKKMVKWFWLDAYVLSIFAVFIAGDYTQRFAESWLKATASLILVAGIVMLLYVISSFYTLFYKIRKTEREVRKLIYQDILSQIQKEKEVV